MQQPPYNPFYKSNEKVIDEIKLIKEDVTKRIKRNTKCTLGKYVKVYNENHELNFLFMVFEIL